jgi:hypothetical protein
VKSCSGDAQEYIEEYNGKWSYYHLMLFLNDTTTPRITDSNISETFSTENSDNLFEKNDDYDTSDTRDAVDTDLEYNITVNKYHESSSKSTFYPTPADVSDIEIIVDSPIKVSIPKKKIEKNLYKHI